MKQSVQPVVHAQFAISQQPSSSMHARRSSRQFAQTQPAFGPAANAARSKTALHSSTVPGALASIVPSNAGPASTGGLGMGGVRPQESLHGTEHTSASFAAPRKSMHSLAMQRMSLRSTQLTEAQAPRSAAAGEQFAHKQSRQSTPASAMGEHEPASENARPPSSPASGRIPGIPVDGAAAAPSPPGAPARPVTPVVPVPEEPPEPAGLLEAPASSPAADAAVPLPV